MILVLGGTTEGREIVAFLAEQGYSVTLSVTTPLALALAKENDTNHFQVHVGKFDRIGFQSFLETKNISVVIDATHPFAEEISKLAARVCKEKNISYLTYQRANISYQEGINFTTDFIEAARLIPADSKVFVAFGVRHLQEFIQAGKFATENIFVRVLPTSFQECRGLGIPATNIITGIGPFSSAENIQHFKNAEALWLVTKASGPTGGEAEKIQAATTLGMKVAVVKRPHINHEGSSFSKADILKRLRGISMKPALIILAHGSKREETKQTLAEISAMVKAKGDYSIIEETYLQFCKPTLNDAVAKLTSQGITKIVIVPYFLFKGIHNTEDIPEELNKIKAENPGLEIFFAEPLGIDERLAQIVLERAQEASQWSI